MAKHITAYGHMELVIAAWESLDKYDKMRDYWARFYSCEDNKKIDYTWASSWAIAEAMIAIEWGLTNG